MAEFALQPPQVITSIHQTGEFDCGIAPLNEFLRLYTLVNSQSGNSRTFVAADTQNKVMGYYSLAATSLAHEGAHERVKQGQPRHPIPAILMARFAVDLSFQGQGLGRALFRDALTRSLHVTEELGARAFVVDAKDENALRFYHQYGMMADNGDSQRLYLLFKDIKKILAG